MNPPTLFFLRIILAILSSLNFQMNLSISLSMSAKKAAGILIKILLSVNRLGSIVILTVLSLLIHEHGFIYYIWLEIFCLKIFVIINVQILHFSY